MITYSEDKANKSYFREAVSLHLQMVFLQLSLSIIHAEVIVVRVTERNLRVWSVE